MKIGDVFLQGIFLFDGFFSIVSILCFSKGCFNKGVCFVKGVTKVSF